MSYEGEIEEIVKRSILLLSVLAVAAAMARPAQAQQITSPYDFIETAQGARAFAGYIFTDRGPIDIGPASGPAFGVGYNIRVSGPFEFDAQATVFPTTRTVFDITASTDSATLRADPKAGLIDLGTADLTLLLLDATLRFDLTGPRTWYNLQPYAMIGVGGAFRLTSSNEAEENLPTDLELRVRFRNGFTGHVGGGVEWHVAKHFSVRADARDNLIKLHVPEGFFQRGRLIDNEEWVQAANLSIALTWRF